jgi:hypothetical protein
MTYVNPDVAAAEAAARRAALDAELDAMTGGKV